MNSPHTSAYSDRPYVAMMLRKIRLFGVISQPNHNLRILFVSVIMFLFAHKSSSSAPFTPTALTPHPANTGVLSMLRWCVSNDLGTWGLTVSVESLALDRIKSLSASSYSLFNIWWISANQPLSSLFGSHSSNSSSVFIIVAICPFNLFFAAPSFLPLASSSNSSHD